MLTSMPRDRRELTLVEWMLILLDQRGRGGMAFRDPGKRELGAGPFSALVGKYWLKNRAFCWINALTWATCQASKGVTPGTSPGEQNWWMLSNVLASVCVPIVSTEGIIYIYFFFVSQRCCESKLKTFEATGYNSDECHGFAPLRKLDIVHSVHGLAGTK